MVTNTVGDSARQFPWQVTHYIMRGGQNDPVSPATGGPPVSTGGILSFNSTQVLPPIPGAQPAVQRVQTINSTTGATTNNTITTNNGGVLIGTIPQGAWIISMQVAILTAFSGGTNDTIGIAYSVAGAASLAANNFAPATLGILGLLKSAQYGTAGLYGVPTSNAATIIGFTGAFNSAPGLGPGTGVAGLGPAGTSNVSQLASLSDIDIYAVTYLAAGGGTAFTAGSLALIIEFSGLEG